MKKLTIITGILIAVFISSNLSAQSDSTDITKREVYDDIKSALREAGEALQVGSEHVYEIFIKQQYVKAVRGLIIIMITIILLFFLYKYTLYINKLYKEEKDITGEGIVYFIYIILVILMFMVSIKVSNHILTGFINPEYGAIQEIKT